MAKRRSKTEKTQLSRERGLEFDAAFARLQSLVDFQAVERMFPVRDNAVYTTMVVLWMLIYQRLNPDHTLEAAVKKLIASKPSFLPDNKRVLGETLSTGTAAYSRARSRLPCEAARELAAQVTRSIIDAAPPSFEGRRVFLLDGTTITLAPTAALQREFPPASNQHGEGVWPVALLTVAHELSSGAALLPQLGAMYGADAKSETALIDELLSQMPPDAVVTADAGFGIFSVAYEITHAATAARTGRDFVLRMADNRFQALRRRAAHTARPSASNDHRQTAKRQPRHFPKVDPKQSRRRHSRARNTHNC